MSLLREIPTSSVEVLLPTYQQLFAEAKRVARKIKVKETRSLCNAAIDAARSGTNGWSERFPDCDREHSRACQQQSDGIPAETIADPEMLSPYDRLVVACETALREHDVERLLDACGKYWDAFVLIRNESAESEHGECDEAAIDENTIDAEEIYQRHETFFDRIFPFLIDNGNVAEAVSLLEKNHDLGDYFHTPGFVAMLAKAGRFRLALDVAGKIPVDSDNGEFHVESLLEIAEQMYYSGDSEKAVSLFEDVLALNESVRPGYRRRYPICAVWTIQALCRCGLVDRARRIFDANRHHIIYDHIAASFAEACAKLGRLDEAFSAARHVDDPGGKIPLLLSIAEQLGNRDGLQSAAPLYRTILDAVHRRFENQPARLARELCILASSLRSLA
ncbi:MAG TPA: hypothetical protein DEB39_11335 [Planctomycetaceae bacterium]|nr:hypothetical protein [Planctomycetaceae bacterium]